MAQRNNQSALKEGAMRLRSRNNACQIGQSSNVQLHKPPQPRQLKRRAATPPHNICLVPSVGLVGKPKVIEGRRSFVQLPTQSQLKPEDRKQKKLKMSPNTMGQLTTARPPPVRDAAVSKYRLRPTSQINTEEISNTRQKAKTDADRFGGFSITDGQHESKQVRSKTPIADKPLQLVDKSHRAPRTKFPDFPLFQNCAMETVRDVYPSVTPPRRNRNAAPSTASRAGRSLAAQRGLPATPRVAPDETGSQHRSPTPLRLRVRDSSMNSPPPLAPRRRRNEPCFLSAILNNNREMVFLAANVEDQDPNAPVFIQFDDYSDYHTCGFAKSTRCGMLPLLAAARISTPGVVKNLLQVGAVATALNEKNQTALHMLATQPGPSFQYLQPLSKDAKLVRNAVTLTSFLSFLDAGHSDAVGVAADGSEEPSGVAAPTEACDLEEAKVREKELSLTAYILISSGVDIYHKDSQGKTALHYAKQFGHPDVEKVLLEAQDAERRERFERLTFQQLTAASNNTRQTERYLIESSFRPDTHRMQYACNGLCSSPEPILRTPAPISRSQPVELRCLTPQARKFAEEFVVPQQLSLQRSVHAGDCTASFIGYTTPVKSSIRKAAGGHSNGGKLDSPERCARFPASGAVR